MINYYDNPPKTMHPDVAEAGRLAQAKCSSYLNKGKNLCVVEEAVSIFTGLKEESQKEADSE